MHFKSFCKTDVCLDLVSAYSLFDADYSYHVLRTLIRGHAIKDQGEYVMMFVYENPN
jgi:hypothetical protein